MPCPASHNLSGMHPVIQQNKPHAGASVFLIGAFFLLLWLPLADSAFHWDRAPMPDEKRAPAAYPQYTPEVKPLRDYFSGLEAYYADHFGFRNQLVHWNNRWKRKWFKESSVSQVMMGRDGWLYFSAQDMIAHARGLKCFTAQELTTWQQLLESRRDWLARRGIKYLFVVPPDKQSIYPEFLPQWLTRTGSHNKLDQLLAHMKQHSTVEILDLRPALRAAKTTAPTYYSTDTHWNYYGSFVGYQELIHALARQLPDLGGPQPLTAFDLSVSADNGGDLAVMLGQGQSLREKNLARLLPRPPLTEPATQADPGILPKDWAAEFLPYRTDNPAQKYNMMMFRDSYAGGWMPYMGYNFKRVIYIFQPEWDTALIEREKPDVVVDEMLERIFCTIETRKLLLPAGQQ
jgi:hypothetical protein